MNISGWVQLQFDCKCFKFSCLKVCWKFQSMLKSVMHVESILKKSVENYKKACWNFQYVLKTVKKHVEISVCSENCKKACWKFQNSSSEVVRSRCTSRFSSTQHSEIFWNIWKLYERYLLQFKRYFTIQMFRIFNFVKFLKSEEVYTRCTSRWLSLEYSGIEIRQFTHSAEIKREIPFCTRKRSETYIYVQF